MIGIELTRPVRRRLGSSLEIHFQLPDGSGWMRTDAVLVRDSRYYGFYIRGIHFRGLDGWASEQLEGFLSRHDNESFPQSGVIVYSWTQEVLHFHKKEKRNPGGGGADGVGGRAGRGQPGTRHRFCG